MKIVTILLMVSVIPIFAFCQFNTVKPIMKPFQMNDSTSEKVFSDTSMNHGNELNSLSWKMVYEQFVDDKNQITNKALAPSYYYPPLHSLKYNSLFGLRYHPIDKKLKLHAGVDLKARYEAVYSIGDGYVEKTGYGEKEGNYIMISHDGIESIYCHLSVVICKEGQFLRGGTCIAISGNTGSSTGPHLHFGLKFHGVAMNPIVYLANILELNGLYRQ